MISKKIEILLQDIFLIHLLEFHWQEGEPISNFLSEDPDEAFADDTIQITRSVLKQTLADIGIDALLQMVWLCLHDI